MNGGSPGGAEVPDGASGPGLVEVVWPALPLGFGTSIAWLLASVAVPSELTIPAAPAALLWLQSRWTYERGMASRRPLRLPASGLAVPVLLALALLAPLSLGAAFVGAGDWPASGPLSGLAVFLVPALPAWAYLFGRSRADRDSRYSTVVSARPLLVAAVALNLVPLVVFGVSLINDLA